MIWEFDRDKISWMNWRHQGRPAKISKVSCRSFVINPMDHNAAIRMFYWHASHQGKPYWEGVFNEEQIRAAKKDYNRLYVWSYLFARDGV